MKKSNIKEVYELEKGKKTEYYTRSLYPDFVGFDENIIKKGTTVFREWDPNRSKLAAAIAKGAKDIHISNGTTVLYLGASHGYTPSFVSDIIGDDGFMFALDFAPRVVRDLVFVCEKRKNMTPLLEDARLPANYKDKITKEVDVVFQDVAQRDQVRIFVSNVKAYMKKDGVGILALKAKSIDVSKKSGIIFSETERELNKDFKIIDSKNLSPYEKDHMIFFVKFRS